MKIDWKRKLASRKFWAALAALVGAVAVVIGVDDGGIAAIGAIISAAGVLIAYILGESYVDAAGTSVGAASATNADASDAADVSSSAAKTAEPTQATGTEGDTGTGTDTGTDAEVDNNIIIE